MSRRLMLLALLACAVCAACSTQPKTTAGERPSGEPQRDFARAVALQREGQHSRSVAFFRAAAAADPNVAMLHLELAKALHNAGLQMNFSGRSVRYVVGRSQDRVALRREALAETQRAIELASDDDARAYGWFIRTRILEMAGDVTGALLCVERGLALQPAEPAMHRLRAALEAKLSPAR